MAFDPRQALSDQARAAADDELKGWGKTRWLDPGVRDALVEQISDHTVAKWLERKRRDRSTAWSLIRSLLFWAAGVGSWALVSTRSDWLTGLVAVIGSVCIGLAILNAAEGGKR